MLDKTNICYIIIIYNKLKFMPVFVMIQQIEVGCIALVGDLPIIHSNSGFNLQQH